MGRLKELNYLLRNLETFSCMCSSLVNWIKLRLWEYFWQPSLTNLAKMRKLPKETSSRLRLCYAVLVIILSWPLPQTYWFNSLNSEQASRNCFEPQQDFIFHLVTPLEMVNRRLCREMRQQLLHHQSDRSEFLGSDLSGVVLLHARRTREVLVEFEASI